MITNQKNKDAKILRLKARIALLEGREEANGAIVKKLKRQLRHLEG